MSQEARQRVPFELLRFVAAIVTTDVAVIEIEGRFGQSGRFSRAPMLVVEDDERRMELAPVSTSSYAGRWLGAYAVDAAALPDGRFALGLRGRLLELGAPDLEEGSDRLATLARDGNRLRRALEAAEDEATREREAGAEARSARETAVAEAVAAVSGEAAERIAAAEAAAEEARAGVAEQSRLAAEAAEARVADAERRAQQSEERATALETHVAAAQGELAEERTRGQNALAELQDALDAARAQERELRKQLRTSRADLEAVRRQAGRPRRPAAGVHETQPLPVADAPDDDTLDGLEEPREESAEDDDATHVFAAPGDADETTRWPAPDTPGDGASDPAWGAAESAEGDQSGESVRVIGRSGPRKDPFPVIPPTVDTLQRDSGSVARWVAVGLLLLFVIVLAVLLLSQ